MGVTLPPLFLLATGVTLNLYAQLLTDLKFAKPEAHIFPTVKFLASLIFAAFGKWSTPPAIIPPNSRQRHLMTLIGILDAAAYVSFCIGFTHAGATLANIVLAATGQVFTALATRFILGKKLSLGQFLAIGCVGLGLVIRALPSTIFGSKLNIPPSTAAAGAGAAATAITQSNTLLGVGFIVLAALLYSSLGIAYEALMAANNGNVPAYPDILWHISTVGAVGALSYQAVSVYPRWSSLVEIPLKASKVSTSQLTQKLLLFGVLFNLHMYTQSKVLKSQGALGVSLVNSVRGAVIAVGAGLFLCSIEKPGLCLTLQTGLSAAVTTIGGLAWVLAGAMAKESEKKKKMKKEA